MENLTGIALVVDDIHKGCNLAFRYPVPSECFYDSENLENNSRTQRKKGVSIFHSLSASLFAKLFRPKNNLCGQCFELTIDDVRFISYPVQVIKQVGSHGSSDCEESHFQHSFGVSSGDRAVSPTSKCLSSQIGGCLTALSIDDVVLTSKVFEVNKSETRMFNLVFAMEESDSKRSASTNSDKFAISQLQSTVQQITEALLHEEVRTSFVSNQVRTLLLLRDELIQQRRFNSSSNTDTVNNLSATSHRVFQVESAFSTDVFDLQTFVDLSLCKSTLANDLKRVYHELKEVGLCHLRVNDWVNVSVTLCSAEMVDTTQFRPYHTLLLLRESSDVLKSLPVDAMLQIRRLVQTANPLKTFRELSIETSLTLSQLYRLSAHLVYWKHAKILDVITLHNIYKVCSDDDSLYNSTLALQFQKRFPRHYFHAILASFTGCRRLGENMKNLSAAQKSEHVAMLIWLLQHDLLVQLHRYVYLLIPPNNKVLAVDQSKGLQEMDGVVSEDNKEVATDSKDLQGRRLQQQYLESIATTNAVFALFRRLCVYFDGKHHFEEIMWRENISRSELRTVLSTYQDIIVCCLL